MTKTRGTDMAKKKDKIDSKSDIKCMAHQHAEFLDKLINLIPARFYLPDETERKWFPGLRKHEKIEAKRQTKENLGEARRDRLDPEKSALTTLDLLMLRIEKEKSSNDDSEEETDNKKPKTAGFQKGDSVSYEELRQRLHRKIDELKGGRGGGSGGPRSHERRKRMLPSKRKRDSVSEEQTVEENKLADKGKAKLDVEEAAKDLTFGFVKIDDGEEHGKDKKKRRLSKAKELERAMKLEAAKKDPEKGEVIAKKHSWQAATSRAAGIKVHDDPKLLKQSIHKEKKRHEKNAEKWKERVEGQQKVRVEKQQKRSGNIADRIEQNKMRKIAKREKKLLRPGFEGRKEGFINEGGK
ncbi:unnamed protein product [Thlaspi arvense]|uniref:Surfeit locus protein 6 n=1 Tax=Thlaspi arvense TaxID=13288 RepID=A0AAU9SXI6_THLAR|nr:unnamed protein product [Thlaspi arvense]